MILDVGYMMEYMMDVVILILDKTRHKANKKKIYRIRQREYRN